MPLSESEVGNGHHNYTLPVLPRSLNSQGHLCAVDKGFFYDNYLLRHNIFYLYNLVY